MTSHFWVYIRVCMFSGVLWWKGLVFGELGGGWSRWELGLGAATLWCVNDSGGRREGVLEPKKMKDLIYRSEQTHIWGHRFWACLLGHQCKMNWACLPQPTYGPAFSSSIIHTVHNTWYSVFNYLLYLCIYFMCNFILVNRTLSLGNIVCNPRCIPICIKS